MAANIIAQLAFEPHPTQSLTFISSANPAAMGNINGIAYGGCGLGYCVHAASLTLPGPTPYHTTTPYHLYSAVGHFLGPSLTDRPVTCRVTKIRDTRTFATRQVLMSQTLDSGEERQCMVMIADFQTREPRSMPNMVYSAKPFRKYSGVDACRTAEGLRQSLVEKGEVIKAIADFDRKTFELGERFIDSRPCPEGIFAQNLRGLAAEVQHTQEDVPIEDRTSADWLRSRHELTYQKDHVSALAFVMDGAISFNPLSHQHMWVSDSGACSTLDFALRLFTNDVDLNAWNLREIRSVTGGVGRTYSESRLWDAKGNMVASMTQQGIMRPKPEKKGKGKL